MDELFLTCQEYWGLRSAIRQVRQVRDTTINQLDDLYECIPHRNPKIAATVADEIEMLGKDCQHLVASLRELVIAARAEPEPTAPNEPELPPID